MEKLRNTLLLLLLSAACYGQTARQVLDKTAAALSHKSGITASFTVKGAQGDSRGTISIKGRKFHVSTPEAIIWFDGKTQWAYIKKNDEVNVSTPTESQLQSLNPYNFIYLYKKGYSYTLAKKGGNYEVHLTATDSKHAIREMYVTVNQKTHIPSQLRMKQSKGWTTVDVSNFNKASLPDGLFRFNSKDFPQAEVIDLR